MNITDLANIKCMDILPMSMVSLGNLHLLLWVDRAEGWGVDGWLVSGSGRLSMPGSCGG